MQNWETPYESQRFVWLGTRTSQFQPIIDFYQNVLGLVPIHIEPGGAALDMLNGDRLEIPGPDSLIDTFMTLPKVGFLEDDIIDARTELEA
jgi:hypothetical protein